MGNFRTFYRGYAVYISGESPSWSFRAEPIRPELPVLANPVKDGYAVLAFYHYHFERFPRCASWC